MIKFIHWLRFNRRFIGIFLLVAFSSVLLWWTNPVITSLGTIKIWDRNGILLYESAGSVGRKIPVTYDRFPRYLIDAAIISEDNSFWTNPGIDMVAMTRSLGLNVENKKIVSGASTMTQQLARAVVIAPGQTSRRDFVRKVREILIALRLSMTMSKKDILTAYLNEMYFGRGNFGVQAASLDYFGKDVDKLSLAESTALIALLNFPEANLNGSALQAKQSKIIHLLAAKKVITGEQESVAMAEPLAFQAHLSLIKAPHFVDYVRSQLDAFDLPADRGVNVYTTLDYSAYNLASDIANHWVQRLQTEHDLSNASLVLLENKTGAIRVMLGGLDYFDATHAGQVNLTTSARQPGSALKPITYATAFKNGFTPATPIYDVRTVYKTRKGEGFAPNNYDNQFHGVVLAREALASSLNLPAVEMLNRVGIDAFLKTARALGISSLAPDPKYDLSLTLGGGEVTLLDLTTVYASFGRGGNFLSSYAIEKITSDQGKMVYSHALSQATSALGDHSRQIAYLITNILADPKARILGFGEKNPLVLSFPAAAKTGTTTDWHDNWTVGYTPSWTVGVWVGNNDNHAMKHLTGITGAAPIWQQFFEEFAKGKKRENFVRPSDLVEIEVCKADGLIPDGLCSEKTPELFLSGTQPTQLSSSYKLVTVDSRNQLLASDSCPPQFITDKLFLDYPPPVYGWASEKKLPVIPRAFSPLCTQHSTLKSNGASFLTIIFPENKATFQSAPDMVPNQTIDFTLQSSPDILSVSWYLDSQVYRISNSYPFTVFWHPQIGKHQVSAEGKTQSGEVLKTASVFFTVISYP